MRTIIKDGKGMRNLYTVYSQLFNTIDALCEKNFKFMVHFFALNKVFLSI